LHFGFGLENVFKCFACLKVWGRGKHEIHKCNYL